MTELFILAASMERVASKSAHMAQVDPHGLTLSLVCVCVVFGALLILYGAYSVSGGFFTGKIRMRKPSSLPAPDKPGNGTTEEDADEAAAIATALHLYFEDNAAHDYESGIITISRK